ncbi:alpha,alpha-trehalose-phosphate synthase (UDP-forming) [Luteipulveratus flavus]|uniref:Trehalose-6-phosphate synthase n=1 Tax=Luteipulveratus flavus TaxID=3031728 RepID=A0ABT6CBS6_9MICO|nr:trehalose-6-phosphate synthase [Luteipulveratus sp. YIM 133296]MDF8266362.1 trehalose-6-phosphate synthase [Luteipulveratus sp. YIM 133296]
MSSARTYDFVIAANRLPVDRIVHDDGSVEWQTSPGGLVTAMESVMRGREAAWVGWSGQPDEAPEPFLDNDLLLVPVPLSADEVAAYYEGQSNDSLWPIYHDVIVPATFKRRWAAAYEKVNRRFAQQCAEVAAPGATVWVHDYQLQLVPRMLRVLRPDVRIGWFNHIPFPPVELFAQLPMRHAILNGLLGADFLGFQRPADAENFLRACRRLLGARTKGDVVDVPETDRRVRAAAVPISIDAGGLAELAESEPVRQRAKEIREQLGNPRTILLGVDRLDYTKGIRHRMKAFGELLDDGRLSADDTMLVQVASPSRERVAAYRELRHQVERTVGNINGAHSPLGSTAVSYLHRSFPREEMAALYRAADVMLVTPLRDGMNLVAKEYVTCHEGPGALVLSEFTGAANELRQAFRCNPHDIEALKNTIMAAIEAPAAERNRRMRALHRQVTRNDVQHWAGKYLDALEHAPEKPPAP